MRFVLIFGLCAGFAFSCSSGDETPPRSFLAAGAGGGGAGRAAAGGSKSQGSGGEVPRADGGTMSMSTGGTRPGSAGSSDGEAGAASGGGGGSGGANTGGLGGVAGEGGAVTAGATGEGGAATAGATGEGGAPAVICSSNLGCPKSQFCALCIGGIEPLGYCEPKPPAECPTTFAPVCGCNTVTYYNDCLRAKAGAGKAHDGVCSLKEQPVCSCPRGSGGVCASLVDSVDACEEGSTDRCWVFPTVCPDEPASIASCASSVCVTPCEALKTGEIQYRTGDCPPK